MSQSKGDLKLVICMTPKFRVSFPSVFKRPVFKKSKPGVEEKFRLTAIFPKGTDFKTPQGVGKFPSMSQALTQAAIAGWGSDQRKWPQEIVKPFRSGNKEKADVPGYENTTFINLSCQNQPAVIDQKRLPVMGADADKVFYAGCYARAIILARAYEYGGKFGLAFSLLSVQKVSDGEPFGSRRNPEDDYKEVEDAANDANNFGDDTQNFSTDFSQNFTADDIPF